MPFNFVHGLLHRVQEGWDPISPGYASEYDKLASDGIDTILVNRLDSLAGGLAGKRVLDLGAGPGHYSVLFAKCGARVTWHDISREYESIARKHAAIHGVSLDFSLGYLEEARKFGRNSFDLVFCRVCWNYCRSDRAFGRLLYGLVNPGGIGYIECNTPAFSRPNGFRRLQHWLNTYFWWKIGHPMPPHGRIAELIHNYPVTYMKLDYSSAERDIVIFVKSNAADCSAASTIPDTF
jgi:2-polyprenyl-3-methyl-5-hydroxy-6-metoxy-1,4-benzoquinol methylase